jgi:3-oxoacyl-[acyl-carrier protein] reductase
MPEEFKGKVVVITGGSRGIGRGIAMAFARGGAQTVLASSSEQNLAETGNAVAAQGPVPLTVAGDLRTLAACEQLFRRVNEGFRRCDVLVNNAGATRAGNFLELADETWIDGFALKFFGAVRLTRLFWPLLKAAQGHLVNIIGGAARTVEPEFLIGGSVNAAAANFTKGLSRLGMRDGVHVNAIHPGQTATERTEQLLKQRASAQGTSVEEVRRASWKRVERAAWPRPKTLPSSRCFYAPSARGTSRARQSGWTAARHPGSIESGFIDLHASVRAALMGGSLPRAGAKQGCSQRGWRSAGPSVRRQRSGGQPCMRSHGA